jgi:hypothetical protein
MGMIEVSSRGGSTELVAEMRLALYGTLCNHRDAVHIRRTPLLLAIPVQGRLQAAQVALHVNNDLISLTHLQPSESVFLLLCIARHCWHSLQRHAWYEVMTSTVTAKLNEINQSGREIDHLHLSSTKAKNMCSPSSTPHASLRCLKHIDNFVYKLTCTCASPIKKCRRME